MGHGVWELCSYNSSLKLRKWWLYWILKWWWDWLCNGATSSTYNAYNLFDCHWKWEARWCNVHNNHTLRWSWWNLQCMRSLIRSFDWNEHWPLKSSVWVDNYNLQSEPWKWAYWLATCNQPIGIKLRDLISCNIGFFSKRFENPRMWQ